MPRRKLEKPSTETLSAIKQAQQRGIPLTEEEANQARSAAYRLQTPKLPFGAVIKKGKNGEPRYWTPDQPKGPGLLESPLSRKLQEMERDFKAKVAKLHRRPPVDAATRARIARTKRSAIERALRKLGTANRNAPSLIAKKLGVSAAYIRKIRKEMQLTEGTI